MTTTHHLARCSTPLLVILLMAIVDPASGQTTVLFDARVKGATPKPRPCPSGAFICASATVAGFGAADYEFLLNTLRPLPDACVSASGPSTAGAYMATITFTLEDGSALTLHEFGLVCGPGASLAAPGGQRSFGNPVDGSANWEVQEATGQFALLMGGGTAGFHNAGAHFTATYTGTLTR